MLATLRSLLALATLVLTSVAHADTLAEAELAIARGRYELALRKLAPLVRREQPRALVLDGQVHNLRGERPAAEARYRAVIALHNRGAIDARDGQALWAVAEAARALGAYRDAHETFARAAAASPEQVEIELAWADLLLEKHATEEAAQAVSRALERAPEHPLALERMARIELARGRDFTAIEALLERALTRDPTLVAAYVTRAGLALRDGDLARADAELARALRQHPRELEALSVRAAVRFVANDEAGFRAAIERVLAERPRHARAYAVVATYAEWEHRYEELVALSEAALALDPEDPLAHATRGLNLLRVGREREGLEALREAWARDHYNEEVFNLLELYERVIEPDYESFSAPPFVLRMEKSERPILAPYAVPLLLRAREKLSQRYGHSPAKEIHVELYEKPEHFAIRATGLPQLGAQGICFGKVVIALSPRAGEFNWSQILWHELSHVFHLELSAGRVPRWFTEGLAEYETERENPEWQREDDRPLYEALVHGRLPAMSSLNRAFTHARDAEEMMVAYYASTRAVHHLAARYGEPVLSALLRAFAAGQSWDEAVTRVLGTSVKTLDDEFAAELGRQLGARYAGDLRIEPSSYGDLAHFRERSARVGASTEDHAALALALAEAGEYEAATSRAEALLTEQPGLALARFVLVHVALKRGDLRRGRRELDAMLARGHDGYQLRMLRARVAIASGEPREALADLESCVRRDPKRLDAYPVLAEVAEKLGDRAELERALRRWAALDQHARAPLRRLLSLNAFALAPPELVRLASSGLERDVHEPLFHAALARGLLALGRLHEARDEAERALALTRGEARREAMELLHEIDHARRRSRAQPARMRPARAEPR